VTESELLAVAHDAASRMDVSFELWISGTFAVLVAFFFVRNNATTPLKWLSAILYSSFSVVMANRYYSVGLIYQSTRSRLEEMDSLAVISIDSMRVNASLTLFLFAIGSAITMYFIFRQDKILGKADDGGT